MVFTVPCANDFIYLNRNVKYLCWFFKGESQEDQINIDEICLQLSQKYTQIPCIRFDYMAKRAYHFLGCFSTSNVIFLYQKGKTIWKSHTKLTKIFILNCFKCQINYEDKITSSLTAMTINSPIKTNDRKFYHKSPQAASALVKRLSSLKISLKNEPNSSNSKQKS